jgi:uncharacterized protein YndB with AHSA1/START domain
MAHATQTVTVDRPIAEVFAFLADGTKDPSWRPEVIRITHVEGRGQGATYAQTMKGPAGRKIKGDFKFTRYEEPNRLDFDVIAGPARPHGSFELREVSLTTTEVTFTMDLKPRGLMVLMTPMINKQVQTEVSNIKNLPRAMGGV